MQVADSLPDNLVVFLNDSLRGSEGNTQSLFSPLKTQIVLLITSSKRWF